jgi:auxin response factor
VGINDYDPIRWPNSKWRSLQVEWDEHGYGERPERVSIWDIEAPENTLVFSSPSLNSKRQCLPGYGGTSIPFCVLRIIWDNEIICCLFHL